MKLTKTFFNDIRELIVSARTTIARGVDLVQVYTNFEIGRRIVEQEQKGKGRAAYGNEVIKALAERLTDEFGGGFSKRNLDYFRRFYLDYADRRNQFMQTLTAQLPESQIMQTLSAQSEISQSLTGKSKDPSRFPSRLFFLSWSHYVLLLGIKNPDERSFYEIEAAAQNWTVRELKRQFDASLYERLALSRDKVGIRKLASEGQQIIKPEDLLKEPLVLEFLGLDEQTHYSESDLETAKQKNKAMVRITLPKDANIHAREYQLYLPSKEELQVKLIQWAEECEAAVD